jgi:hypothetical protein
VNPVYCWFSATLSIIFQLDFLFSGRTTRAWSPVTTPTSTEVHRTRLICLSRQRAIVMYSAENRYQHRSQCRPLCRLKSGLFTDSAAFSAVLPPTATPAYIYYQKERCQSLYSSTWRCRESSWCQCASFPQGGGGGWQNYRYVNAAESVNRILFWWN